MLDRAIRSNYCKVPGTTLVVGFVVRPDSTKLQRNSKHKKPSALLLRPAQERRARSRIFFQNWRGLFRLGVDRQFRGPAGFCKRRYGGKYGRYCAGCLPLYLRYTCSAVNLSCPVLP